MLLGQSQHRLLLIAAGVCVVLVFGFFVPPPFTTWPTAGPPAGIGPDHLSHHDYNDEEDYLSRHDYNGEDEYQYTDGKHEPPVAADPQVAASVIYLYKALETVVPALPSSTPSSVQTPSATHLAPSVAAGAVHQEHGSAMLLEGLEGYTQVFSSMTPDKKWFPIDFGDYGSYNPNLLPHPYKNDTYVMIAQGAQTPGEAHGPVYSLELVCDATYTDGKMKCLRSPTSVPIASTVSDDCTGDLEWFNYFIGPNDPRVFFGPDRPYITYGSASHYTCLGQWIHDLRRLVMWNSMEALDRNQRFFWPTELQRPAPYGKVEKNWFAFWDQAGDMYLHYDIYPKRSYARVSNDGTQISEDLAPTTATKDEQCIQKHMPPLQEKEHIHQATNSLAITMCKRSDAACDIDFNTYVFTIFHHKQYHGHNLYEPYIMMLKHSAPFDIHAISAKPFWINGRGRAGSGDPNRPADQSQMMYITSMAWKAQNMTYQGYLDDELLINFGVEDKAAGAIDVVAGDLLRDMNLCSDDA